MKFYSGEGGWQVISDHESEATVLKKLEKELLWRETKTDFLEINFSVTEK